MGSPLQSSANPLPQDASIGEDRCRHMRVETYHLHMDQSGDNNHPAARFAYIAQGALYVRDGDDAQVREIESPFVRDYLDRQSRNRSVHGWKGRSAVWGEMGMAPPMWSQWEPVADRNPVRFRGATCGPDGQLIYTVDFESMCGLFQYDLNGGNELRLMHRNDFPAADVSRHPRHGNVAVSVAAGDGTASIAVGESDGRFIREVTVGDSVDEAPHWVDDDGKRIVYQSAGIGRNHVGFAVALGPYSIGLLDVDKQSAETVLDDEHTDYLQPRMTADGSLYYIRRPYVPHHRRKPGALTVLKDVLLFPFRLGRAFFDFFNFFSMMFSGKPLTTAGGPSKPGQFAPDNRYVMLWGQMVDTKQVMQDSKRPEAASLVPRDWQLVRRSPGGDETVLAEQVLAWDVGRSGSIVYSNGTTVFAVGPDGQSQTLCRDKMIERVVALS